MSGLMHDKKNTSCYTKLCKHEGRWWFCALQKPTPWLFQSTTTHTNDNTRKLIEPYAPTIESCRQISWKIKNHCDIISINPYSSKCIW